LEFPTDRVRAERLDEALQVLKRLFTEDAPTFPGRHYRLDAAPSLPRPVQAPHPPIHIGGAGERRTLPLVARHADVWNCPTYALGELPQKLAALRAECESIGRDPASLRITEEAVLALAPRADQVEEARTLAARRFPGPGWGFEAGGYCGAPDVIARRIEERARLGVNGFVFFLHDRAAPQTIRLLAREVRPGRRPAPPVPSADVQVTPPRPPGRPRTPSGHRLRAPGRRCSGAGGRGAPGAARSRSRGGGVGHEHDLAGRHVAQVGTEAILELTHRDSLHAAFVASCGYNGKLSRPTGIRGADRPVQASDVRQDLAPEALEQVRRARAREHHLRQVPRLLAPPELRDAVVGRTHQEEGRRQDRRRWNSEHAGQAGHHLL